MDWKASRKLWQCEVCSDILGYTDMRQQANSGCILCQDCFDVHQNMGDAQYPPRLCDECGMGIGRSVLSTSTGWTGHGRLVDLCISCSTNVPPDEEAEAIAVLLNVLNETDTDFEEM